MPIGDPPIYNCPCHQPSDWYTPIIPEDVIHTSDLNVGRKDDQQKKRWSLVQFKALDQYVDILELGAKKYGDHNWKLVMEKPDGKDRYFNALMRHVLAWKQGEKIDPESGLNHLAHVICNAAFLLETEIEENE